MLFACAIYYFLIQLPNAPMCCYFTLPHCVVTNLQRASALSLLYIFTYVQCAVTSLRTMRCHFVTYNALARCHFALLRCYQYVISLLQMALSGHHNFLIEMLILLIMPDK